MADLRTDHGPNPYVLDIEDVTTQLSLIHI